MAHFRVNNVAVGSGEYLARFKTKSVLQPLKCSAIVLINDRRNEGRAVRDCGSHLLLLDNCRKQQYLTILIIILSTPWHRKRFRGVRWLIVAEWPLPGGQWSISFASDQRTIHVSAGMSSRLTRGRPRGRWAGSQAAPDPVADTRPPWYKARLSLSVQF